MDDGTWTAAHGQRHTGNDTRTTADERRHMNSGTTAQRHGTAPMDTTDPVAFGRFLGRRAIHRHWLSERVRWSDTDHLGHVNNLSITNYCEIGRTAMLQPFLEPGAPLRALFLVARMATNFHGEVHWPATVDVGTSILEFGTSSCRIVHGVFVGERCVATADSVIVHIDEAARTPQPVPETVRARLSAYLLDR